MKFLVLLSISILFTPLKVKASETDTFTVMTWNIYVGGDVSKILKTAKKNDPVLLPEVVTNVYKDVIDNDFSERAAAIADEVFQYNPDVIGLQEVALYMIDSPGDFYLGNPTMAEDVVLDYLSILMKKLRSRGLEYKIASVSINSDTEIPMNNIEKNCFDDLRLIDRDVILVRSDLPVIESTSQNFYQSIAIPYKDLISEISRGMNSVVVMSGDREIRIINTHLEVRAPSILRIVQSLQMSELLAQIKDETRDLFLIGDFNSPPQSMDDEPYKQALKAGFIDSWAVTNPLEEGNTCCFDENLRNKKDRLQSRYDHIFYRSKNSLYRFVTVSRIGHLLSHLNDNDFMPSDHAGLVATVEFADIDFN